MRQRTSEGAHGMEQHDLARRTVLRAGAAVGVAGLASVTVAGPAAAFGGQGGVDEVLPWLDQPDPIPPALGDAVTHPLIWEDLDSWRTPNAEFFTVRHYDQPALTAGTWRLEVDGLVEHPGVAEPGHPEIQIQARGGLHSRMLGESRTSVRHRGHRQRPVGRSLAGRRAEAGQAEAGGHRSGVLGADQGTVTIRDNSGVTGGRRHRHDHPGRHRRPRPHHHRAVRPEHVAGGRDES